MSKNLIDPVTHCFLFGIRMDFHGVEKHIIDEIIPGNSLGSLCFL